MKEAVKVIKNKVGLHARPAALFVQTAAKFKSNIVIAKLGTNPEKEVNAKSILSILSLAVNQDSQIRIRATGEDEEQAVQALLDLIDTNFGEGD